MYETTTIGVPRRALSFAAVAALALGGTVAIASGSQAAPDTGHKVWVCKYVDKPGVAERLKAGKQPIFVDWHSLTGKSGPPKVGDTFSDAQGKSVVVQIGGSSPGRSACETKTPPTTKPPKTSPPKTPPPKKAPPKKTPPALGGGVPGAGVPGVGAPKTGGAGDSSPANGLIGSGLLLAAGGVLARDAVLRRRAKFTDN